MHIETTPADIVKLATLDDLYALRSLVVKEIEFIRRLPEGDFSSIEKVRQYRTKHGITLTQALSKKRMQQRAEESIAELSADLHGVLK